MLAGGALTSGLAGAWSEREMKRPGGDGRPRYWAKNAAMALLSLPLALGQLAVTDAGAVRARGLLGGFTGLTWAIVALQALSGLLVALVVKKSSAVLKNLAGPLAVILTVGAARALFGDPITPRGLAGAATVSASVLWYGLATRGGKAGAGGKAD